VLPSRSLNKAAALRDEEAQRVHAYQIEVTKLLAKWVVPDGN